MNIHFLQHVPFEGLGSIAPWIETKNYHIHTTRLFNNDPLPDVQDFEGLIVMGGPMGIYDYTEYPWLRDEKNLIRESVENGKKVLGICLGAQLIADVLGSKIYKNKHKEIGWFPIEKSAEAKRSAIDSLLPDKLEVFHWHGDTFNIPKDAVQLFSSEACANQAFIYNENILALQFHLEMMYQNCEEIIKYGLNDLTPGPYVQSADEMLRDKERFNHTNILMNKILQYMFKAFLKG